VTVRLSVEEAVRRSHCDHPRAADPEHECVGKCTLTREGARLDCALCGGGDALLAESAGPRAYLDDRQLQLMREVLYAIGVRLDALSERSITELHRLFSGVRLHCPHCFQPIREPR
jgi:hypothetical protein